MKLRFRSGSINLEFECRQRTGLSWLFPPPEIFDDLLVPKLNAGEIELGELESLGYVTAALGHNEMIMKSEACLGFDTSSLYSEFIVLIYEHLFAIGMTDYAKYREMLKASVQELKMVADHFHFGRAFLDRESRILQIVERDGGSDQQPLRYGYLSNADFVEVHPSLFRKLGTIRHSEC